MVGKSMQALFGFHIPNFDCSIRAPRCKARIIRGNRNAQNPRTVSRDSSSKLSMLPIKNAINIKLVPISLESYNMTKKLTRRKFLFVRHLMQSIVTGSFEKKSGI